MRRRRKAGQAPLTVLPWMLGLALALAAPSADAAETWRFLPCYGNDIRGLERPHAGNGHFHEVIPEPVRRLLDAGAFS